MLQPLQLPLASLLLLTLCMAATAQPATQPTTQPGDMIDPFTADRIVFRPLDLTLEGALFRGDAAPPPEERKDLVLYLGVSDREQTVPGVSMLGFREHFMAWAGERRDDGPEDIKARRFNNMDHEGTVTRADAGTVGYNLSVKLDVHDDPWVPGGEAQFNLLLRREGDQVKGTYTGTFRGQPISGSAHGSLADQPWPAPVADWKPLERGEHPRIMFRKSDLEHIRQRAATPTGQRIVARMKALLGGGESMPAPADYTLGHAVGFGMLYQLTGEQKYADLAQGCVQLSLDGTLDDDQRYSFQHPGGKLRGGPSTAHVALAYDLCYHAWPEDFRKEVAAAIQEKLWNPDAPKGPLDRAEPTGGDLVFNTGGGQHSPQSNHYGAWNGGGGLAALAIMGDPGTDDAITQRVHRVFLQRGQRALEVGYGDSGWFFEGHHGGRLNFNTGLAEYLAALRTANGLELVRGFEGGDYLTTKWLYELTRQRGKIQTVNRGIYAGHGFRQSGWSGSGDFALGFAHTPPEHNPAILWFYQHVIQPGPAGETMFDSIDPPSRAAWALVNWPIQAEPVNPGNILPKYLVDPKADYFLLRSGWSDDGNDWVLAVQNGNGMLRGPGVSSNSVGVARLGQVRGVTPLADGQGVLIDSQNHRLLADMTGVSGAPIVILIGPPATTPSDAADASPEADDASPEALLKRRFGSGNAGAAAGPAPAQPGGPDPELARNNPRAADRTVQVGGQSWRVITLQSGPAPALEPTTAQGRPALRIGDRLILLGDAPPTLADAE